MFFAYPKKTGDLALNKFQRPPHKPDRKYPSRSSAQAAPILQRSLGNGYLQAIEQTNGQSVRGQIQRACTCGGSCSSCMQEHDIQGKLQTKVKLGDPHDKYEQEADRVAETVVWMSQGDARSTDAYPTVASTIQRMTATSNHQTQTMSATDLNPGGGQPLSPATRAFMEPRFGVEFGHVRLHNDERSQQQAAQVNARAFTYGNHIWLGRNESEQDKRLMAHELTHVLQQNQTDVVQATHPVIQRYSHQDCEDADLRNHIWPADWIAKQMVEKAIRVLSASPIDPAITPLFSKYFMTSTPSIADILSVFQKIKTDFDGDSYQYECEYDCTDANAYVYGFLTDVHLCMNYLRGRANDCIASTIVHEFSHYSAGTDDESGRCYDCGYFPGCPADLSVSDAVDHADAYAAFAYELYPMPV